MLRLLRGLFRRQPAAALGLGQPGPVERVDAGPVAPLVRMEQLARRLGNLAKPTSGAEELTHLEISLHAGSMVSFAKDGERLGAGRDMMCAGLMEKSAELAARLPSKHPGREMLAEMSVLLKRILDPTNQIEEKLAGAAVAIPERTLFFPKNVGEIHTSSVVGSGYRALRASGEVPIPAGWTVQMIVNAEGARDLSWANRMPPAAFQRLEILQRTVRDGDLHYLQGLTELGILVLPNPILYDNCAGYQALVKALPKCRIQGGLAL